MPVTGEASVKRYLDCSTGNLPHEEFERLDELTASRQYEYGTWVWVHPDDADYAEYIKDFPMLRVVMDLARFHECEWINFDEDAPHVEGLPAWEW